MKIGIITFWTSDDNYGQLLQCYALQRYLKDRGHDAFLIRYIRPKERSNFFRLLLKLLLIYPVFLKLLNYKRLRLEEEKRIVVSRKNSFRRFHEFRERYLEKTLCCYNSLEELKKDPPIADCYITGSDQVWAQLLKNQENNAFFLDFGSDDVKRISYAASFGMEKYPTALHKKLIKQLSRFNLISVRENSGVSICEDLGFSAIKVMDPVFLLEKDHYPVHETKSYINENYIYIYSLNISSPDEIAWNDFIDYNKSRYKIIVTPSTGYVLGEEIFTGVEYQYPTPEQWIGLIKDARLVITTSFHGVAFCLLYSKKFVYFPLKGKLSTGNNRVMDLLQDLDMENRIVDLNAPLVDFKQMVEAEIDWDSVHCKMDILIEHSKEFLSKI